MEIPAGYQLDEVYAAVDDRLAGELVAFWTGEKALDETTARERVKEVAVVLRDDQGAIRGVSSAFIQMLPFLGNRPVWVYRNYLSEPVRGFGTFSAIFRRTREVLEGIMDEGTGGMPEGILVTVPDPAMEKNHPEAVWTETGLTFMGRTRQGQQLRIAWMKQWGQHLDVIPENDIPLHWVHGELDDDTRREILDFWQEHDAVPAHMARRRVDQVAQLARGEDGRVIGVCTIQLKEHAELGLSLWDVRAFVSEKHRRSMLGFGLLHRTYERMEAAFINGEDRRARGFFMEVQNDGLKRYVPEPLWAYGRFAYIGDSADGHHRRVQYFPGALITS